MINTREQSLKLIQNGILAPSPDNYQPWIFRLVDGGFELRLDRSRGGYFFDPRYAASLISCGSVLENVAIAAEHLGLGVSIESQHSADPDHVATVTLSPGPHKRSSLYSAISQRCTHRGLYQRRRHVPPTCLEELRATVDSSQGFTLHWFDTAEQRRQIIRILAAADRIRFTNRVLHEEFHSSLRFGEAADRLNDGLAADTLGIETIFLPILKRLQPWKLASLLNRAGLSHIMAARGSWAPLMSAPLIGALMQVGGSDAVQLGRQWQKLWLRTQDLGLKFQPFCALPLFLVRLHECHGEGFSEAEQDRLRALEQRLDALVSVSGNRPERLMIPFRIGYAPAPTARARRRPTQAFLSESTGDSAIGA